MKSKSTQALLVLLGAAIVTQVLTYLSAGVENGEVSLLIRFIQYTPAAVIFLILLKFLSKDHSVVTLQSPRILSRTQAKSSRKVF